MKSKWTNHNGRRIFYTDFSGFGRDTAALRTEVDDVDAEILRQPKDSVLALADLRGTVTGTEVVDLFKKSAKRTNGYVRKQAVVGITGVQRILASAVARFSGQSLHLFDTIEEANEWLAADKSPGVEIEAQ
ncbi:MAG TPA: hypothetical protein VGF48_14765 [Thermoanaerobaculia bacterium]|jgi:hypothetical protein